MNLREAIDRAVSNTRMFGVGAALSDIQYLALNRLIPVTLLKGMTAVMDDVDRSLLDTSGFAVRLATADELRAAAREPGWQEELAAPFLDGALIRGDECVGIFDGGRFVSMGWYSRTPTPISATQVLHFDSAWTYMYKGYTLPAYRGKRLHGIGMSFALKHYSDRGSRGLISYVEFNNLGSMRSVEKMGYRIFGDVYIVLIAGREIRWATPGCRSYRFELRRREN